jgi:hypothetical protein
MKITVEKNFFKVDLGKLVFRVHLDWYHWFLSIRVGYNFEFTFADLSVELGPLEVALTWN